MADGDAELEEKLVNVGKKLVSPPSDVKEVHLLLDETESLLLKVEQSPTASMSAALRPAMDAVVAKELVGHLDVDVRVAVASCISEITRITAPEAPYEDELMRVVFGLIVEAFQGLHEISSPSYNRRVSILETVAKVRSSVVMLDLECNKMILEMFHHFMATIRDDHPENVFSLMETIMTLVVEESEDICPELLNCLLDSVKNDNKDILPVARQLGEKVIGRCSKKLKPYLLEAIKSRGASFSDYSGVVASTCQDNSIVHENNCHKTSGECMEEDSKLSETTISEELPQGAGGMESQPVCSDVANTTTSKLTETAGTNGNISTANEPSLDSVRDANEDQLAEKTENNLLDNDKKLKLHVKVGSNTTTTTVVSPVASDTNPGAARPRRGRPPGSKTSRKKSENFTADVDARPSEVKEDSGAGACHVADETVPSVGIVDKKADSMSDSEEKPLKHLSKKRCTKVAKDGKIEPSSGARLKKGGEVLSDTEAKTPRSSGKEKDKDTGSKKSQTKRGKPHKESSISEKNAEGEQTPKEMSSLTKKTTQFKDGSHSKGSLKTKTYSKHARDSDETLKSSQVVKDPDEKLIGANIKVWWPDDKKFYRGVVDSYSQSTKKHTIFYTDGDVEVLLLKSEKWELLEDKLSDEVGDVLTPSSSKLPSKKKKGDSDSASRQGKIDRGTSTARVKVDTSGHSGKRGTASSRSGKKDDMPKAGNDSLGEDSGKRGTDSSRSGKKDDMPKAGKDSLGEDSKTGTKFGTAKVGKRFEDSTPRSGSKGGVDSVTKSTSKSKNVNILDVRSDSADDSEEDGEKVKGSSTVKRSGKSTVNGNVEKTNSSSLKAEENEDSNAETKPSKVKASDSLRKRQRKR